MARTKEFDQDIAVDNAIRLFSRQGYAATSTDELIRAMGIGRQSMYDTFGDKKALFLKALRRYSETSCGLICAELSKPGPPVDVLRAALVAFADRKDMASTEGCMGLNALAEFGLGDIEVNEAVRHGSAHLRAQLIRLLRRAAKTGQIAEDDVTSAADFIESTFAGLRYAAKKGASRKALRSLAEFAGHALSHSAR